MQLLIFGQKNNRCLVECFNAETFINNILIKTIWRDQAEGGKSAGKCAGNGREKSLEGKREKERKESKELHKPARKL